MAKVPLQLPQIQNWSCHNCSGCCRQHRIEITKAEKHRIEQQKWTPADGIPEGQPVIEPQGKHSFRLAHQPDGACVFLNEDGLCRIHAKFGEDAKPLACRVYPYTFHPAGSKIAVSLRFSCPSVVGNHGRPVRQQSAELQSIARQVVPAEFEEIEPPAVYPGQTLPWNDILQIVSAAVSTVRDDSVPLLLRLLRLNLWTELVSKSDFQKIRGQRLTEYLELIPAGAAAEIGEDLPERKRPDRLVAVMFRLTAGQFARRDTQATLDAGFRMRAALAGMAFRLTTGIGSMPRINAEIPAVPFAELEKSRNAISPDVDAVLARYFEVKLRGLHFCGSAHFGWSLVDGLRGLILMYPVFLWLARCCAVSHGRETVTADDVAAAITVADHNYAFSPGTGGSSARKRVELIARMKQLPILCAWYAL